MNMVKVSTIDFMKCVIFQKLLSDKVTVSVSVEHSVISYLVF